MYRLMCFVNVLKIQIRRKLMKMKKKTIKTIGITAGVIAAVGAGVTAVCLAIKNKKKPAAEIPYPASAWDTK